MFGEREFHVFVSAVNGELASYRAEVARVLRRKGHLVRDQDYFSQGPATLLERLADYIRDCNAVILLVGDRAGAFPSDDHAAALGTIPVYEQYRQQTGQARASYTQWEFLLAKHFGKPTYVFAVGENFTADAANDEDAASRASQAAYRQWIERRGEHWNAFDTKAQLVEHVLVIEGLLALSRAKPIALPYPPLGALFKGRDDFLEDLRKSLARGSRTAIVGSALYGLGGIGKTRAAVEYAWAHAEDYSALLFVIADTPEALRRNLAALAGPLVLNLPEQNVDKEEVRIAAALDWLKNHPRWFLILDNLDTPEAGAEANALIGRLSGGHVVVTSRLKNFAGDFESLALDVLTADDAAAFLLERTAKDRQKRDDDAGQARALAVDLGQLALGLEQAGAYIVRAQIGFARYRRMWRENWDKVAKWADENLTHYPRSVAVTWQTSIDRLGGPARGLLERLAFLAPEPVPDFLLEAPAQRAAEDDCSELLAELAGYSLIRRDPDRGEFSVHRLVQDVTRRSLSAEAARAALTQALALLDAAFTGDLGDLRLRPNLERLAPHVRAAAQHGEDAGIATPTARLLLRLGDFLFDRVPLAEIDSLYRRALALYDRLAKSDPGNSGWQRDLSVSYEKVGDVQVAQGDLAGALKSFRDSLAIIERLAKADPDNAEWQRDLAQSYAWLAYALEKAKENTKAMSPLREGRDIMARLTALSPTNAQWKRDLAWFDAAIARLGGS